MSFIATGSTGVGISVKGLAEAQRGIEAVIREGPQTRMKIHRLAATFFVFKAKEKVHVISGDLGRTIEVESITPERAIVSAGKGLKYAYTEERRKGSRKTAPHTPHAYMKPSAVETANVMGAITKQEYDALWAKHKSL